MHVMPGACVGAVSVSGHQQGEKEQGPHHVSARTYGGPLNGCRVDHVDSSGRYYAVLVGNFETALGASE